MDHIWARVNTRWWFQIFFIFTPIWGRLPFGRIHSPFYHHHLGEYILPFPSVLCKSKVSTATVVILRLFRRGCKPLHTWHFSHCLRQLKPRDLNFFIEHPCTQGSLWYEEVDAGLYIYQKWQSFGILDVQICVVTKFELLFFGSGRVIH